MSLHDDVNAEDLLKRLVERGRAGFEQARAHGRPVPLHLQSGLLLYLERGILPGSYLQAVLCNDLAEACARGDELALEGLADTVAYLYNFFPRMAWGSRERVLAWTTTPDRLEV